MLIVFTTLFCECFWSFLWGAHCCLLVNKWYADCFYNTVLPMFVQFSMRRTLFCLLVNKWYVRCFYDTVRSMFVNYSMRRTFFWFLAISDNYADCFTTLFCECFLEFSMRSTLLFIFLFKIEVVHKSTQKYKKKKKK